jgi:N-acetylmuramoyl-L-alanine amidase
MKKRIVVWMTFRGGLKVALSLLMVIILVTIFTYDLPMDQAIDHWSLPLSGKIIALDAGHGGPDGGAVGYDGLIEKDITLPITLYLRDYLQQSGAVVVVTREDDRDLAQEETKSLRLRKTEDLIERVKMIKESDAELLVSIHLNSIPAPQWYGAQTFFKSGRDESKKLAYFIQDQIIQNLNNTTRQIKSIRNVYLLEANEVPSALVEVGFLSNPQEAELLRTEMYQKKVAASIYEGILRYYSHEQVPGMDN